MNDIVKITPKSQNELSNEFLFYASDDGTISMQILMSDDNVWVTQKAMAEIFATSVQNIGGHLKNIFRDGELNENVVVKDFFITTEHGAIQGKTQSRKVNHYNLDAIISVGYRVNSYKATQFRVWATKTLKEYLIKGFVLDDERLKQGKILFNKDYFDELLERIREIRASEKRFYGKIREIYKVCSYDYDKNSPITKNFYADTQNKLFFAVTGMTAAEIKHKRASYKLSNMGLTTWKNQKKNGKILKSDIKVAKNYLIEKEFKDLNRLDNMFLDYIENLAIKGHKMTMNDWANKLSLFLSFNEYEILQNYGSITAKLANIWSVEQYEKYKPIQEEIFSDDLNEYLDKIKGNNK